MSTKKRKKELIPPWDMPSDPVKAVWWFLHWVLKVVVRFCWIPIGLMVIYETYVNWNAGGVASGIIGGVITLLVGLGVWALLYVVALLLEVSSTITRTIADVSRFEQQMQTRRFNPFDDLSDENVVEGTITDLDEERKKRRRE